MTIPSTNPLHAAVRSIPTALLHPSPSWMLVADPKMSSAVDVQSSTMSTSSGLTPAISSAFLAASVEC